MVSSATDAQDDWLRDHYLRKHFSLTLIASMTLVNTHKPAVTSLGAVEHEALTVADRFP